jgi:hypothetical protein
VEDGGEANCVGDEISRLKTVEEGAAAIILNVFTKNMKR